MSKEPINKYFKKKFFRLRGNYISLAGLSDNDRVYNDVRAVTRMDFRNE